MDSQKIQQLSDLLEKTVVLKELCSDRMETKLLQKNYNGLICLLLKEGISFQKKENPAEIMINIDGITYTCPSETVRNILREDYQPIMDAHINDAAICAGISAPASSSSHENKPRIVPIRPVRITTRIETESECPDAANEPQNIPSADKDVKDNYSDSQNENAPIKKHKTNVFAKLSKEHACENISIEKPSHIGFVPKKALAATASTLIDVAPKANTRLTIKRSVEETFNTNDTGKVYKHICLVYLSKKLGSEITGPYRITFFPTKIPGSSEKSFADALVIIESLQNEIRIVRVCDSSIPEITINIDGKEFKICGMWYQRQFSAHISLIGKTASIFSIEIEEESHIPTDLTDAYLEQFRIIKKGQPFMFVVPTSDNNCSLSTIPIIGYIDYNGHKYPLISGKDNHIRYSLGKRERSISGKWSDGSFCLKEDKPRSIHFEF